MATRAWSLTEQARWAYDAGQCDRAVKALTEALRAEPGRTDARGLLVELLVDSGRFAEALAVVEGAVCDTLSLDWLSLKGRCHEALGDEASARRVAETLGRQWPGSAQGAVIHGRLAARSGRAALSESCFREALRMDPQCALACLGLAHLQQAAGDSMACLDWLEQAFRSCPTSREIVLAFHDRLVASECFGRGENAFREVLVEHPLNRRLRFLLIDILLRQDKFVPAMAAIEAAMADFGVDSGILAAARSVRERVGFRRNGDGKASVSLCMIVKDEQAHLARCLHSVAPVVDEIVIVDTGSTDRTRDIATAFGARVADVPWTDDFSAARNAALELARCEWILVLDADEVISVQDHDRLRQTIRAATKSPAAFRMRTRNYTRHVNAVGWHANTGEYPEEEGPGWIPSDKVRLFTRDERIRFRYPVHELVEPSLRDAGIAIDRCDVPVHHYGKLQEATTQDKTRTYRRLGRSKLRRARGGGPALRELAIQASQLGQHKEAIRLWTQWERLHSGSAEAYLNIGAAWWNLERYGEAAEFAVMAQRLDPELKEAVFNRASAHLMSGHAGEAKIVLEALLATHADYSAARFMLGVVCACLGDPDRAEATIGPLKQLTVGDCLEESFADIVHRMVNASLNDYAGRVLSAAVRLGCAKERLEALARGCGGMGE
jgi:glycosyltransferase involved in cell wall biosynthesis